MLERVGIRLNAAMEEVAELAFPDTPSLTPDGSSASSEADERTTLRGRSWVKEQVEASEEARYPTDPILSDAQVVMIRNLNSIPQLRCVPSRPLSSCRTDERWRRKHLAFFPAARNAHGTIVARSPEDWAEHKGGFEVVDAWAREFRL